MRRRMALTVMSLMMGIVIDWGFASLLGYEMKDESVCFV